MNRENALTLLRSAAEVAVDIEIADEQTLLCVGFASSPNRAFVFRELDDDLVALLEAEQPKKIFANGQFDIYFLRTRCGIEIGGYSDDTQLAWHSCYPELAGKSDWKSSKVSRKSLKFLISLFLDDPFHKDYDTNVAGMYELNGIDCCTTFDIMTNHLRPLIAELGVEETYRHELKLVPLCVASQQRGLRVDEERRQSMFDQLDVRVEKLKAEVEEAVRDDVEEAVVDERVSSPHLFVETWVCSCCRNGSKKREHCPECAGIVGSGKNGNIVKNDLVVWAVRNGVDTSGTIAELEERIPPCEVCGGDAKRESFCFNANSDDQKKMLLYEVWKLPVRYKEKKPSVAEDKLKAAIASERVKKSEERQARAKVMEKILWIGRCAKMRGDYAGLAPHTDGKIRTVMNPSGTETGRLSHSGSFLEPSRNLGNMAKKRAGLDPLFDVRSIFIPDDGYVYLEADLSQAEARIAAYMAADPLAMEQYEDGVDRYRFFASHFYGKPIEEITKAELHVGKTAVLALQYGVAWKTFKDHVNEDEELTGATITAAEAKKAVALFHELYPGYRRWHNRVWREAERNGGWLRNPFERRRDFFGRTDSRGAVEAVRREMVAFLPQSTSVDHMNRRLVKVFHELDPLGEERNDLWRFLLQVHDSGLGETRRFKAEAAARKLKRLLEVPLPPINGRELVIPVEVEMGESWASLEEVEL